MSGDAQRWNFAVSQFMKHGYSRQEAEKRADSVMKSYVQQRDKGVFTSAASSVVTFDEYAKQVKSGKIEDTGMNLGLKKEDGKVVIRDMPASEEIKIWGTPLPSKLKLPSLSLPSIGLAGKGLIGVVVAVGVVIVVLIALGYSRLGGAAGSRLKK